MRAIWSLAQLWLASASLGLPAFDADRGRHGPHDPLRLKLSLKSATRPILVVVLVVSSCGHRQTALRHRGWRSGVHRKVELQMERESVETEATSERAERLANLLALSYEPMLVWRLDGAIEFWNAGAERLYGFSPREAVGRSSHSLLQTKFPIDFAELRALLRSERYWSGELRHVRKDGDEVVVNSRMQLLGGDTVLEVNRDVTEIKSLGVRQATLLRDHLATAAKF